MINVGLDMSFTGTGFCLFKDNQYELKTIKTKPKDFPNFLERLQFITDTCLTGIPKEVDLIAIEDYYTPHQKAQMGSALNLVALGTLMRIKLYESGLPFVIINNKQLKKWITGKGNSQKSMIIKEVYKRLDVDAKDDNQADACVLADLAKALFEIKNNQKDIKSFSKYQIDVLDKIYQTKQNHYNWSL